MCKCDCGVELSLKARSLTSGHKKSCGCLYWEYRTSDKNRDRMKNLVKPTKDGELAEFNRLFGIYKSSAKKRKLGFLLSKEEFKILINLNCIYCNIEPSQESVNKQGKSIIYNGIDRIDSNIGYTINNCVTSCYQCNIAKWNYSQKQFYEWIERVYNWHMKQ